MACIKKDLRNLYPKTQEKNIDISVIIPVYNAGVLIDRCLYSVSSQKGNYSIEVIVVDDGSTDNSVELIRKRPEQDRIRLFSQSNAGPSKARNRGIMEARGKYLAFLDADDYWMPDFLSTTIPFLEKHQNCVAVSVAQRHLTTTGQHEAPKYWPTLAPKDGLVIDDFFSFWADHHHVCTGSILIRSEVAKASGGMREDLRLCEDLEYWALLSTYGKMGYVPALQFVSDGSKVTESVGWVQKHMPRWKAAVPVENWQKRIVDKDPAVLQHPGFQKARGRIARNLIYSILMSGRKSLAMSQIKKHGKTFPKDNMSRLLNIAVMNPFYWWTISSALIYREHHRK